MALELTQNADDARADSVVFDATDRLNSLQGAQ
jgi:hypothetical protein